MKAQKGCSRHGEMSWGGLGDKITESPHLLLQERGEENVPFLFFYYGNENHASYGKNVSYTK